MTEKFVAKIKRHLPHFLAKGLPKKIVVIKVSQSRARVLNIRYRAKRKAANVLSFRYDKGYGEILICPEVIRREAKAEGNSYTYQMTWMILHGMLHLAGMHHEFSGEAGRRVQRLEESIMLKFKS